MVDIANELIEFKSKVNGKLSSMEQSISALSSKIDSLKNICTQTSSSINAAYKSSNKDALLSKFENINTVYDKIKSVMTGELNSVLSKASNLLSNINSLEAKKSEIDSLSSRMNSANENYQQVSNNYNLKLSEFNELQTKSLNMLKELKSTDGEITFQEEFQVETIQEVRQNLQFGSYQRYHYTSSTNYQMSYYLYKPDYGSDAANSNLPTLVYFPGQGEQGNNTNAKGLPALINQKKITPAGMVLIPQVKSMEDPKYRQAIMELIDHVITENKGDKNRISISGHSIGATMGYKFLEENPDYFAAFVPVSGKANRVMDDAGNISNGAYDALSKIKMLSVCGTGDTSAGNFQTSKKIAEKMQTVNQNIHFVALEKKGHNIQDEVFVNKYKLENGKEVSLLDWAFNQTKKA